MKPTDKILYVLELVETAIQLAPKNEHCFVDHKAIDKKKLTEIELHSILKKLEKDDKVLEIIDGPFESGVVLWDDNTPRTFKLKVLGKFDDFYNQQYELSKFGIKNLSHQNYYKVYGVAQEIHQELNIIKGNNVDIEATKATPTMWKGINQKSISLRDIKQMKVKALNFLREIEAIDAFQLIDIRKTEQAFRVVVTRRKFDKAFLELILNSPERKSSSLTKKLIIDKQPKPKEEKPDYTLLKTYEEPTPTNEPDTPSISKVDIQPLQPGSYHDKSGKLNVSAGVDVPIAKRGKVTRKNRTKYDQCHLMSCLFNSVNTLNNGITFSKFLGVKYDKNNKKHIRKIRNTIDEINEKVAERTTAKKLILPPQGERIFIDKSYL